VRAFAVSAFWRVLMGCLGVFGLPMGIMCSMNLLEQNLGLLCCWCDNGEGHFTIPLCSLCLCTLVVEIGGVRESCILARRRGKIRDPPMYLLSLYAIRPRAFALSLVADSASLPEDEFG
jgi:hypothetical protein